MQIGREVLISTISAFRETILSNVHEVFCENIGMLCSLASVTYQNHPVLCERFWSDWDSFTTKATGTNGDPLCYLLESAYTLSVSALNAAVGIEQQPGLEEALLPALEPLLRLVSSLCSNSGMVQSVVGILPDGMIRTALLCCSPARELSDEATFFKHALSILNSIATLDRIGNSTGCRLDIRRALEVAGNVQPDGPRVLFRIVTNSSRSDLATGALQILADLFESSSDDPLWALAAGKFFAPSSGFSPFLTSGNEQLTFAAVQVLKGFMTQLTAVAFSPLCSERDISGYLQTVMQGTAAACSLLSSMLAATGSQSTTSASFPYPIAQHILELIGTLLKSLRPIVSLHGSPSIRSAGLQARNTIIDTLATSTSLGDSISYIATAPVSLSLAAALNKHLEEAQVLSLASNENDAHSAMSKYGAWRTVMQNQDDSKSREDVPHLVGEYLEDLTANIHKLDIDMEAVYALGWIGDDRLVCLQAARAAMNLILVWATHAQDIVAERNDFCETDNPLERHSASTLSGDASIDLMALSPYRLLTSLAVVPPPVQENRTLLSIWPREKISTIFLMLRFLPGEIGDGLKKANELPVSASIELLTVCFTHAKLGAVNQVMGSPSLSMVLGSPQHLLLILHQSLKMTLQLTSSDSKAGLSDLEKEQVTQARLLLRMLCTCVETQPHLADSLLVNTDNKPSILMDLLVDTSSQVASSMQQHDTDYIVQLSHDMRLMCHLRIASGCLDVLSALWKTARTPEGNRASKGSRKSASAVDCVIKDRTFLADLVTIVTKRSSVTHTTVDQTAPALHKRAILMNFVTKALDIVSIEMVIAMKKSSISDTDSPWGLIKREMENGKTLVSMSRSFTSYFDAPQLLSATWGIVLRSFRHAFPSSTSVEGSRPTDLLLSFPALVLDQFESSNWAHDNLCNVPVASSFLARHSVVKSGANGGMLAPHDWNKSTANVQASYLLLSRELKLIFSWKQFAQALLLKEVTVSNTGGGRNIEDAAMMCLSMSRETLESFRRNVEKAELSQLDMPRNFLCSESGSMACALADLLLQSLNQYVELLDTRSSQESTQNLLTEMLGQLYECSDKMFSIMCRSIASTGEFPSQPSVGGVKVGMFKVRRTS